MKKLIFVPIEKVRKYLKQIDFYQNPSEIKAKKIFIKKTKEYLKGDVSAAFLDALANEFLYNILSPAPGKIKDHEFRTLLEATSELEFLRSQNGELAKLEDSLKSSVKTKGK